MREGEEGRKRNGGNNIREREVRRKRRDVR